MSFIEKKSLLQIETRRVNRNAPHYRRIHWDEDIWGSGYEVMQGLLTNTEEGDQWIKRFEFEPADFSRRT